MRIFKNRGDIYVPRAKVKSDLEQRILLIILAFVFVFTIAFVLIVGAKYNFSPKAFFKPASITEETDENNVAILPDVEGKINFLFILSNKDENTMHFCELIQVDLDTLSYKACTLDGNTLFEETSLSKVYSTSGGGGVLNDVQSLLGISVDYYIDEDVKSYEKMFDSLGKVTYTILEDVKYKDTSTYGFNMRLRAGEQNLDGNNASELLRYYVEKEKNYSAANDIFLYSLSQHVNEENYQKREKLFSTFIEGAETNITVKDFTLNEKGMEVLSAPTTGANVYNVVPVYDGGNLTSNSVADIKGYFEK